MSQGFKDALASWASGVSVVAARAGGLCYGLTVSSFTSLSFDPPLVLVCITNENRLPELIRTGGGFTVSVLAAGQEHVSTAFSRRGREPGPALAEAPSIEAPSGRPVLVGAIAWVDCELHDEIAKGDHQIVIGRVVGTFADPEKQPLTYFRRGYHRLA